MLTVSANEKSEKFPLPALWMDNEHGRFVSNDYTASQNTPVCRKKEKTLDGEEAKVWLENSVPDAGEQHYKTCLQTGCQN